MNIVLSIVSRLCYSMSNVNRYLAEIGRRGGIRSRRTLDPDTARRMVRIREARRAIRRARDQAPSERGTGTPADTSTVIQNIQDTLWLRLSPAEKLAQVAGLSRMVEMLAMEGLRMRHPGENSLAIWSRRAEARLGRELFARAYGTSHGHA